MNNNGQQVVVNGSMLTKQVSVTSAAWQGETVKIEVEIDFDGVPLAQLYSWAAQTLVINLQSALRKCDLEFVKELARAPYRRHASSMGVVDDPSKVLKKAVEAVDSMSPEQLEALLMALQSKMNK